MESAEDILKQIHADAEDSDDDPITQSRLKSNSEEKKRQRVINRIYEDISDEEEEKDKPFFNMTFFKPSDEKKKNEQE